MDKLAEGLRWIVGVLRAHDIPFQLTGGLAAHAYGATRAINDIDIDIPESAFETILPDVAPFVISGPKRYRNEVWDVQRLELNYHGQLIDVCGAFETRIKDRTAGVWRKSPANFDTVEPKIIFDIAVPVINREELIEYKRWIAKPNDHQEQDIREILEASPSPSSQS